MILRDLLAMCRTKAQAAAEGQVRSIDLLHEALAGTLELFNALNAELDPADATSRLCQEHGVRIDGRTKNRFIPLLKLVFGIMYGTKQHQPQRLSPEICGGSRHYAR